MLELVTENTELRLQLAESQDQCVELAVDAGELHAEVEALRARLAAVERQLDSCQAQAEHLVHPYNKGHQQSPHAGFECSWCPAFGPTPQLRFKVRCPCSKITPPKGSTACDRVALLLEDVSALVVVNQTSVNANTSVYISLNPIRRKHFAVVRNDPWLNI